MQTTRDSAGARQRIGLRWAEKESRVGRRDWEMGESRRKGPSWRDTVVERHRGGKRGKEPAREMERDVQKHRCEGEGERRRGEETQVRGKRQGGGRERWGRTERQKQGGKDVEVRHRQTEGWRVRGKSGREGKGSGAGRTDRWRERDREAELWQGGTLKEQ